MSHRTDRTAYPRAGGSRCRNCGGDGENCKCVAPGEIVMDTADYRHLNSIGHIVHGMTPERRLRSARTVTAQLEQLIDGWEQP